MKTSSKYYWQPDWTMSIVFWSAMISCLFLGVVTLLEYTGLNVYSVLFFLIFLFLVFVGFQRYLQIDQDGTIHIHSLSPKNRVTLSAKQIVLVREDGKAIQFVYVMDGNEQSLFLLMRTQKKEQFLAQIKNLED